MFGDSTTVADVRQIMAKRAAAAETSETSVSVLGLEHLENTLLNSLRYLVNMSREAAGQDHGSRSDGVDVEAGVTVGRTDHRDREDRSANLYHGDEAILRERQEEVDRGAGECFCNSHEEKELNLMELPVQVLLHIFSFLGAQDISSVGSTCRQCHSLCSDQLLWKDALEKDKLCWRRVDHRSNPALYEEVNSDLTYKEIYMRCSPKFQRESSGFNLLKLPRLLWSFIPHKPPKVVMFGPGLESNSTTLVRKFLGSGSDVFKVRGVFPALLPGVGTGFQVSVNGKLDMRLITLYSGTKLDRENPTAGETRAQRNRLLQAAPGSSPQGGGEEAGRGDDCVTYEPTSTIKELCRNVDAFIFVVDAMVGLESMATDSRPELFALMNDRWTAQKCPLVLLSCVPNPETARVPCVTMAKELALHQLNRAWKMFDVDVSDLSGVVEAVTWLVEIAQGR
ncbi:F-box only protein 4-like isoform X2 [Acanthaster planci]|uniref:F-box only protein 4-like isoform X2 n=1 Tax=Acanthaster planci TaxID=133434 RepID=A0A8B7Y1Y2_ACAPL|nr:F-box only protein 4-like isoform X2 [Acanthaster planci]